MANLFWRQLRALVRKNFIVLSKHSFVSLLAITVLAELTFL
jgi:ATP-binding cassette subfamily A (ABC1) protein 3